MSSTTFNFTELVLNIPFKAINDQTLIVDYYYNINTLEAANKAISLVSKFHSYFHFEQSAAYLFKAYALFLMQNDYKPCLEKAIFQDHLNKVAIEFLEKPIDYGAILSYDSYIKSDADFFTFAIGTASLSCEVITHRHYFEAFHNNVYTNLTKALENIEKAIDMLEKSHEQYHKHAALCYIKRANIFKQQGNIILAKNDLVKANDLFEF